MSTRKMAFVGAAVAAVLIAGPASAQYGMDRKPPRNAATPELPHCDRPLGTAAVKEPDRNWWNELGLSNPETLLKLFAARSNCLRMVDRAGGLEMRTQERALGDSGELQRGSNLGRGQVRAADYFIVPDIANANSNSGGNALGAIAGGLLGGSRFGALAGSISTRSSEAQALITLTDARTTEQLYVAEGVAKKTDISFGAGGGGGGWGGFAAAAGGGYSNTDIGKVITAAYFNAFVDLIHYMQGLQPGEAQAAAPIQAYTVKSTLVMRAGPSPSARPVRTFQAGDLAYPTGQTNGVWWEVDDENGNRGWVSNVFLAPRG